jgi:hypothetical protein
MSSKKVISAILVVAVAGSLGTAGTLALVNTPKTSAASISSNISSMVESSSSIASSTISSAASSVVSSQAATSQKETNDVSKPQSDKATTSEVKKMPSQVVSNTIPRYALIDPKTGHPVSGAAPNYDEIQAELNEGCDVKDAGIVPPNQSKACQAALARLKAASTASAK